MQITLNKYETLSKKIPTVLKQLKRKCSFIHKNGIVLYSKAQTEANTREFWDTDYDYL